MKKIVSMLLVVCMCLSVGLTLSACSHEHTYQTEWSKDATHHWHKCEGADCEEVIDKAEHTWNGGEITTPASKDAQGVKTFTCTECGQTKTEPVEYVPATTTTLENWNKAFDLGENWVIALVATHPVLEQKIEMTNKRDGNKFYSLEIMSDSTGNVLENYEDYDEISNGVWYWIHKDPETGDFIKSPQSESVDVALAQRLETFLPTAIRNFSDYEYSEDLKAYVADSIVIAQTSMEITNVAISLEDDKIVSVSYNINMGGAIIPYSMTFTYGNAEVVLPVID